MKDENLPGSCKTMYALNFRMGLDEKDRDFALIKPKPDPIRIKQKGKFKVKISTGAKHWLKDRDWAKTVNTNVFKEVARLEAHDLAGLKKRKAQKLMQS